MLDQDTLFVLLVYGAGAVAVGVFTAHVALRVVYFLLGLILSAFRSLLVVAGFNPILLGGLGGQVVRREVVHERMKDAAIKKQIKEKAKKSGG